MPASHYAQLVNPSSDAPVLALDIGGTKLAAGVVDRAGATRSFLVVRSRVELGPGAVLDDLFELVVLGGGVTRSGGLLFEPASALVRENAMAPAAQAAEIVPAALGDRVGVVGAAAIVYADAR